ncbi:histidine phosphatase family protein [Halomonas sp. EGI 63088]|uniref:Histidine phosphatase family protein n=1 Tax=Halomonas flagellata TaxID=2920385 RepID=A0ABS9RT26_9GAMM|nr:histidine phosphatase family protein [Halomonas flagellata]MCH4563000.1 histidine phosphatase family protein [Halomonas flagellata]
MPTDFLNARGAWRNRYLLMRHGHSRANEQGLIISDPRHGLADYGLSAEGEAQLARLVDDWAWPAPTLVLHSDFLRTTQTAGRVAEHFGLSTSPEPRLRERHFGEFESRSADRYLEVWALDERDPAHRTHGVEPVAAVAARMQAVLEELERTVTGMTILLVSHGDPLQILLTALEGRPLNRHRDRPPLLPASITPLGDAPVA